MTFCREIFVIGSQHGQRQGVAKLHVLRGHDNETRAVPPEQCDLLYGPSLNGAVKGLLASSQAHAQHVGEDGAHFEVEDEGGHHEENHHCKEENRQKLFHYEGVRRGVKDYPRKELDQVGRGHEENPCRGGDVDEVQEHGRKGALQVAGDLELGR